MRAAVLEKARSDPRGTAARLLDAAEEVFAELGYSGSSTREIARRARVPFGALHYHWGAKSELYEAVFERLAERSRDTVMRNLVRGNTPGEILDGMTDAFVELLLSNRHATRLLYRSVLEPGRGHVERAFEELARFGVACLHDFGLDAEIDGPAALHVISTAFLGAVVDEPGQKIAFGDSVFSSRPARERLRAELRRVARAVFKVSS